MQALKRIVIEENTQKIMEKPDIITLESQLFTGSEPVLVLPEKVTRKRWMRQRQIRRRNDLMRHRHSKLLLLQSSR